ncbi:related to RNA exonuclease 4 [Saccharomycodes ludwigii]|uniref:RNA exonuclease 4 n=1 Tax=Saccharomycodes ludwigii TaxID=36035 RepID=A0A376B3Q2_9ASCO|nr:hypothetical protein SCDLUD_002514 [Saccharomycodes ludwigii]KAH3901040.1 hypothetical protein SCDLUD_002514 [Saccharomycodes ludwigii]SSD59303.1 related to RNA exonuclease 4 [Saccharomycodes ludwigii]
MVYSSNWQKLQKTLPHKKQNRKVPKQNGKKIAPRNKHQFREKKGTTDTPIMQMVNQMTKIIETRKTLRNLPSEKSLNVDLEKAIQKDVSNTTTVDNHSNRSVKSITDVGKYISMDCEFVGVGVDGSESVLARISIVNFYGQVVMDEFVKPKEKVTDFRTWVSGIRPSDLQNAISFEEAQAKAAAILDGRILIGHSIQHDLDVLLLSHPSSMIRDTSRHLPFREKYSKGKTPSLKKLAKEVLNIDIQGSEHSSVEDAKVTMLLYKSDRKEFEKLQRTKPRK